MTEVKRECDHYNRGGSTGLVCMGCLVDPPVDIDRWYQCSNHARRAEVYALRLTSTHENGRQVPADDVASQYRAR